MLLVVGCAADGGDITGGDAASPKGGLVMLRSQSGGTGRLALLSDAKVAASRT